MKSIKVCKNIFFEMPACKWHLFKRSTCIKLEKLDEKRGKKYYI